MSRPLIFDARYVSKCSGTHDGPGPCPTCGRDLVALKGSPQRHCSDACKDLVGHLPLPEREARRAATPAGTCVGCGADLPAPAYRCRQSRNAAIKRWRATAGGRLRFGPEAFAWLAEKVGLEDGDERLPEVALALAKAGKLTVLVDRGRVVGIAKAKR